MTNEAVAIPCADYHTSQPAFVFIPGWIYDSLKDQEVNIVKAFRDGNVYDHLSRDQRLDLAALENAAWLIDAAYRAKCRPQLSSKLPAVNINPYNEMLIAALAYHGIASSGSVPNADKVTEVEYFADMLVEQRFVTVIKRLFTLPGGGWIGSGDSWQLPEVRKNFYEFVTIDNRMLIVVREGFFAPLEDAAAAKVFCEDLYRNLVALSSPVEVARLPSARELIKTLMLP